MLLLSDRKRLVSQSLIHADWIQLAFALIRRHALCLVVAVQVEPEGDGVASIVVTPNVRISTCRCLRHRDVEGQHTIMKPPTCELRRKS